MSPEILSLPLIRAACGCRRLERRAKFTLDGRYLPRAPKGRLNRGRAVPRGDARPGPSKPRYDLARPGDARRPPPGCYIAAVGRGKPFHGRYLGATR